MTAQLKARIAQLEARNQLLLEENEALRKQLSLPSNSSDSQQLPEIKSQQEQAQPPAQFPTELSTDAKIELFRVLFRQRRCLFNSLGI